MQVRTLTQSDFGKVFQIWFQEIYRGPYLLLYSREEFFIKSFQDLSALFGNKDVIFLGIEEGEGKELMGALLAYGDPSTKVFICPFLWVSPSRRRQRLATTLVDVMLKFAKERKYSKFACETSTRANDLKGFLKQFGAHQIRTTWVRVDR